MKFIKIPKKTPGEFRDICVPNKREKAWFRERLPYINTVCLHTCNDKVVHGFSCFRSVVTNAWMHVGFQYTLKFDLSNFFDTVTPDMVREYLGDRTKEFFVNGRAFQGLPTSPQIANLAAVKLDKAICDVIDAEVLLAEDKDGNLPENYKAPVYTRYADDLTFSFNDYAFYAKLKEKIPGIVAAQGFTINLKKTRLQSAKFGWRSVTGISVGQKSIKAKYSQRQKAKALRHNYFIKTDEERIESNLTATLDGGVPLPLKVKKIVTVFKPKPTTSYSLVKLTEGLIRWTQLTKPHMPMAHTDKVITETLDYLKAKDIISAGKAKREYKLPQFFGTDMFAKLAANLKAIYKMGADKKLFAKISDRIWQRDKKSHKISQ